MNEQAHIMMTGKVLLERSSKHLGGLEASLKTCIESARKNFSICHLRGADIDMSALKGCFSTIQEGSKKLCERKDWIIAGHEDLIAVALKGEERDRPLYPPDANVPAEWKEDRWEIKPEHCLMDSVGCQVQMTDLVQLYVDVIFNGALKLQLMSANLAGELLNEASNSTPSSTRKDRVNTIIKVVGRVMIEIVENSDSWKDWLNFEGRRSGDLPKPLVPTSSASS